MRKLQNRLEKGAVEVDLPTVLMFLRDEYARNLRRFNMAKQNIYDNETFFAGYKKIRDNEVNANNLFEIPALFSMMPDLKGKKVLDLGCGFGEHCKQFVNRGAQKGCRN